MSASRTFLGSTIGKKIVMAGSGTILSGFVLAHMLGNLQLYLGADALNAYSVFLHEVLHGAGLWIARAVLLAALGLHVWAAASLTAADRAARPVRYREFEPRESTYASRTMRWSGVFLFAFVVYHLLDLTFGTVNPSFQSGNVFHNVVASFRVVPVALLLHRGDAAPLAAPPPRHVEHAAHARARASALRAHGAAVSRRSSRRSSWSGNMSFPLAVLFGFVR